MKKLKLEFENASGMRLAGMLEMPNFEGDLEAYAIFAHCFTCGKDIAAATRISRAQATAGGAVLRVAFTGLGNSNGDFGNTNFSSNVQDLLSAAYALEQRYQAPQILIGHSLGGAAVLSAAVQLESIRAVVTIGAPSSADHVKHLFKDSVEQIQNEGEAAVSLGGREFLIKKQFLEDIDRYASPESLGSLNAALLIFHSPLDTYVSIDEAGRIYQAAKHPKSFISLDRADHLFTRPDDSEYVADSIAAWVSRYLRSERNTEYQPAGLDEGEVLISELNHEFLRGMHSSSHYLRADEPLKFGGSNLGPTPYDLLLMALGSCTSMTLRMYAKRKKLPLEDVNIRLRHERVHATDCIDCNKKIERITRDIELIGDLDKAQRKHLLEIADRCPVHRTLESDLEILSELVD